jgi:hypothetical protein
VREAHGERPVEAVAGAQALDDLRGDVRVVVHGVERVAAGRRQQRERQRRDDEEDDEALRRPRHYQLEHAASHESLPENPSGRSAVYITRSF